MVDISLLGRLDHHDIRFDHAPLNTLDMRAYAESFQDRLNLMAAKVPKQRLQPASKPLQHWSGKFCKIWLVEPDSSPGAVTDQPHPINRNRFPTPRIRPSSRARLRPALALSIIKVALVIVGQYFPPTRFWLTFLVADQPSRIFSEFRGRRETRTAFQGKGSTIGLVSLMSSSGTAVDAGRLFVTGGLHVAFG
jgi:hypothetical protein